jgi:hypothetical protein
MGKPDVNKKSTRGNISWFRDAAKIVMSRHAKNTRAT